MMDDLQQALHRFATTYMNTGADWEEACSAAETALARVKHDMPGLTDRRDLAQQVDLEAYRYADM